MKSTHISTTMISIALIAFVTLVVFFLYTFLHEAGHAIAGLLFGQTLTEFDVSFWDFNAHVGLVGGDLTDIQLAVRSVAATLLPFLVWVVFILWVPHQASFTLEVLKLISSIAVVNTLLPWIIIPILFLVGKAPVDDVINFMRYAGIPPVLLTVIALALYIIGWKLFLSKIRSLRDEFYMFRTTNREQVTSGTGSLLLRMASLMALCILVTFLMNAFASKNSLNKFSPPDGFVPVAEVDLSKRAYSSETLAEFTLEKPEIFDVFVVIHNINTTYFDLSVTRPDGFRSLILHGEGYNAVQDGGLWQKNLPPGSYQVVLTSHPSPGTASIYLNTP